MASRGHGPPLMKSTLLTTTPLSKLTTNTSNTPPPLANWTISTHPPAHQPSFPSRGPYPLPYANLGGLPTTSLDTPITAIFLLLFFLLAITHLSILRSNLLRAHKFLISALLFGFCMARLTACTMRLVFASYPHSVSIAIAAQIFVAAGVLLLFIINLLFTQRVMRAMHPWAWSRWFGMGLVGFYISVVGMLIALVFCTVQSFFTLDEDIRRVDRIVQRVGGVYFAVAAFLPILLLAANFLIPRTLSPASLNPQIENFGTGKFTTKVYILLASSALLSFGAAFRAGITFLPRLKMDPAWYHDKACFYVVNFAIEVLVVAAYAVVRVDRRFWVPDGSRGPGDYLRGEDGQVREGESSNTEEEGIGIAGLVEEKSRKVDGEGEGDVEKSKGF